MEIASNLGYAMVDRMLGGEGEPLEKTREFSEIELLIIERIVTINIKIGDVEGLMNVCLPYLTLEDIMDKLNTKYWYSTMQDKDEQQYVDAIETLISKAPIPMKAVLGNSTISVSDFSGLQVGDIIRLDTKVNQELDVFVGNIKKFTALPGSSGDKYAVRITSVIREEQ